MKSKPVNKTKYVILGLLTIEPLSGYDMRKMMDTSTSHFWEESNGQIYPTIKKLLEEKMIKLEEKKDIGKKQKIIYSITEKGTIELQSWLSDLPEKYVHRDEGLLKLFLGGNCSIDTSISLLKNRQESLTKKLKEFESIGKMLDKQKKSPHHLFWVLTLKNGIHSIEAELKWCRESVRMLKENSK